ncbi:ankyrin repeat and BTB/POZ domain-containing protein 1 [Venturia nashicola]|uniref:Ankyrin repeat and BTB/POZ domain-containing protein 1 n=1 Tax=Venturia nashicola TaxID=86259 RepID=A0A4Z1NS93_9PEZI|nr:ankyrin repeat and BTB/POZ domain-containing protein 1 [Venturia nashicola]TLD23564.1 ankyrin repeat and BTB/POZ domain-containing protein 1 [Venturia nashicola]
MVLRKDEIEKSLYEENQAISQGRLKEDSPLDLSDEFSILCEACRRGDLKVCQEQITSGVNINARDRFDYTPLILASLCGHYEVVQLLLESGALCERDTFQGERCLYNALNNRIRNLLLQYDYSKSTDPLQPLAAAVTSLLTREHPQTSDITLKAVDQTFHLHKFVLAARSPYFAKKLALAPETTTWRLPNTIPSESLQAVIRWIYLSDAGGDFGEDEEEQAVLTGIEKLSRQLEVETLFETILERSNRRLTRQRRQAELERGRDQLETWFKDNILRHKIHIHTSKADSVQWDRNNGIFADVLLRADEDMDSDDGEEDQILQNGSQPSTQNLGIPIGPFSRSRSPSRSRTAPRKSILFPAHRAMLLRSEFFSTMFASAFREAQDTPYLQIIPIDCSPEVLEVVLTYLYTERSDFSLDLAIGVLFAADLLFVERLKVKAAQIISTLGNGAASVVEGNQASELEDLIDIYDVIRAGWDTRVHRLEEFGARYLAYRLERYIDEPEFLELIRESAARIKERQETDTIELIDDIRYYLSERFRLRFEEAGLEEMMNELELDSTGDPIAPAFESGKAIDEPTGVFRTLEGEDAGDEFAVDARDYEILLAKIDGLLERLKLAA